MRLRRHNITERVTDETVPCHHHDPHLTVVVSTRIMSVKVAVRFVLRTIGSLLSKAGEVIKHGAVSTLEPLQKTRNDGDGVLGCAFKMPPW